MTPTDRVIEAAREYSKVTSRGYSNMCDLSRVAGELRDAVTALDATPDESVVVTVWYQGSGMSLLDTSRRPTAWPHGTRLRITVEEGEGEP